MANYGEWQGFTVRVTFEGLCGFVTDEPFFFKNNDGLFQAGKPNALSVVLPDARSPGLADWERSDALLKIDPVFLRSSHAPLLALRPYDIADMKGFDIDGVVADPVTQEVRQLHVLDCEHVYFDWVHRRKLGLTFCDAIPDPSDQELPGDCDTLRRSLWWLPRMVEIQADCGECGLLKLHPNSYPRRGVAGRIDVPGGHLSVTELNSDGNVPWSFGTVTRVKGELKIPGRAECYWNRAIGTRVCCEFHVKAPEIYLVVLDGEGNKSWVGLQPNPGQKLVEVAVINGEMETLAFRYTQPWVATNLPDVDFQILYSLSTCRNKYNRPVPIAHGYSGVDAKPCSSASFTKA